MARPRADVREAELLQELADRALVIDDAEALLDHPLQVDPAPAHDPVFGPIRPRLDDLGQVGQLLRRKARPGPFDRMSFSPSGPCCVEPMNPVAQRLPIHPADPRRLLPAHPVQHRGQRQKPPALLRMLRSRRKPPKLGRRKVRPHLNR